ncbi:anti-sigma factor domain-containing protein [Neobacillus niacini]|uniref:anti-sigma-I factor RsgI family protein n=1 Tax=Neobacillus niacini TaxID=86668 RepID=UPI0030012B48
MKKGIIMEVDDPFLTLLTPDGEFLRARKQDRLYIVGEEIDFFPVMDSISSKYQIPFKNFFKRKSIWMSVASLLVCFASIFPIYQSNKAYAYMSIGAGTSIELGLNKKMQVVEIKGFNQEAEDIIRQIDDWKKKDAAEITTIILTELKDEGLLAPAEPLVISTVKTEQLKEDALTKLEENINKIKKTADKQVEVNQYTTTKAEVEKAESLGVSIGIYHKKKNDTAKSKEKLKSTEKELKKSTSPQPSTSPSTLPPGQAKKIDETINNHNKQVQIDNGNKLNNNHQINNSENKNMNGYENRQDKGNQAATESIKKNNGVQNRTEKQNNHDNKSAEENNSNNHDNRSQKNNSNNHDNRSQQKNNSNNQEKHWNK